MVQGGQFISITAQKMKFSIKDLAGNADLVTFTDEILHGKLHFLCSVIWKVSQSLRRGNKYRSIRRLNNFVKILRRTNKLEAYGSIIQEQRANEIIRKLK